MINEACVETYQHYLDQIGELDLPDLARRIGVEMDGDEILLPFYDSFFRVSGKGIFGPDFKEASMLVKVVLSKYLLMFPSQPPQIQDWVSYRDFPDAAPFAGSFRTNVEMTLSRIFAGKRMELMTSCAAVGGFTPTDGFDYDASMAFQALPHMDVLLLFNDADETFPSKCLVLFDKSAQELLDMESLAGVAWRLAYLIFNMSGFELPED